MSLSDYIVENEKTFAGTRDIKYLLIPAKVASTHLIVAFSGFNGKEAEGELARYNYVKHLNKIDCNRLFIIDSYGHTPCYYLGRNRALDYEVSVMALIYRIAGDLGVAPKDIITCGTSKGGTAALYLGVKYNLGHAVAGGFQFRVGEYLFTVSKYTREVVLDLIAGGHGVAEKDYLDNHFLQCIRTAEFDTHLHIHGGKRDRVYASHVLPCTDVLTERGIPFDLDLGDYEDHSEIGLYFSDFLIEQAARITCKPVLKSALMSRDGDGNLLIRCTVPKCFRNDPALLFAYYIYRAGESDPVETVKYSRNRNLTYAPPGPGSYNARVFLRRGADKIATRTLTVRV